MDRLIRTILFRDNIRRTSLAESTTGIFSLTRIQDIVKVLKLNTLLGIFLL